VTPAPIGPIRRARLAAAVAAVACLALLALAALRSSSGRGASAIRLVDRMPKTTAPSPAALVRRFDFDRDAEGWAAVKPDVAVAAKDGLLVADIAPESYWSRVEQKLHPPIVAVDVSFDASDVDVAALRIAVPASVGPLRVVWLRAGETEFDVARGVPIPAIIDGKPHEHRVVLGDEPAWEGRIVRVGVLLPNVVTRVSMDWFALEHVGPIARISLRGLGGPQTKIGLGSEVREAVVVAPGADASFDVAIPRGARFEFAVAAVGRGEPSKAVVEVSGGGRRVSTEVEPDRDRTRWVEGRLDLSEVEASSARIVLRAVGGEGVAFGTPVVVGARPPLPNVILISLDTLRADHLGCFGYARETSPRLDRFALEGVAFADATSQAPHTLASHMSLMTSVLPSAHGIVRGTERLSDDVTTLAERLRDAGLRTAAVVEDGLVSATYGFHRGFERYDQGSPGLEAAPDRAALTFRRAEARVRELAGQSFFLFVHTYGIHTPYNAPTSWAATFDPGYGGAVASGFDHVAGRRAAAGLLPLDAADVRHVVALYDNGIRAADEAFGGFVDRLAELGLAANTIVIVVADHGEEFFDHRISIATHGHSLYQELVHVPLIVRWPVHVPAGNVAKQPVALVDVQPTILALLSLPAAAGLQGVDVSGAWRGAALPERAIVSQELYYTRQSAVRIGREKLIHVEGPEAAMRETLSRDFANLAHYFERIDTTEVYDLDADPGETNDLSRERPAIASRLRRALASQLDRAASIRAAIRSGPARSADPELERRLRALGYVDGGR
jgi:arylsulfatase A-like enzyme